MQNLWILVFLSALVAPMSARATVEAPIVLQGRLFSIYTEIHDEFNKVHEKVLHLAHNPAARTSANLVQNNWNTALQARTLVQGHFEVIREHWRQSLDEWHDDFLESVLAQPLDMDWSDVFSTTQRYLQNLGSLFIDLSEPFPGVLSDSGDELLHLYPVSLDAVDRPVSVSWMLGNRKQIFSDSRFRLAIRYRWAKGLFRISDQNFSNPSINDIFTGLSLGPHRLLRAVEGAGNSEIDQTIHDIEIHVFRLMEEPMTPARVQSLLRVDALYEGVLLSLRSKRPDVLRRFQLIGMGVDLDLCRMSVEN